MRGPTLDASEGSFDPRYIAFYTVEGFPNLPVGETLRLPAAVAGWHEDRNQVLAARKDEVVGLRVVVVPGQPFVGLASDGRKTQTPPEPKRSVAGT
jgi:hypothetical protein